jgi:hypothetical protein
MFFGSTVFSSGVQVSEKTVSLRDSPEAGLTKSGFFQFRCFRFRSSDQSVLVATLRVRPQDLRCRYFRIKSRTKTSGEREQLRSCHPKDWSSHVGGLQNVEHSRSQLHYRPAPVKSSPRFNKTFQLAEGH